MKSIISYELKSNIKSALLYIVVIAFLIYASVFKYETVASDPSVSQVFNTLPNIIKVIYGMDNLDITNIDDYMATVYLFVLLIICVYSSILGGKVIKQEEDEKTADFLFAKPISRAKILFYKSIANIILISVITALSFVITEVSLTNESYNSSIIIKEHLAIFCIAMLFLSITTFVSCYTKSKVVGLVSHTIVLGVYVISVVAQMAELSFYLTPFNAFGGYVIINEDIIYQSIICILLTLIFWGISFITLSRRDIK